MGGRALPLRRRLTPSTSPPPPATRRRAPSRTSWRQEGGWWHRWGGASSTWSASGGPSSASFASALTRSGSCRWFEVRQAARRRTRRRTVRYRKIAPHPGDRPAAEPLAHHPHRDRIHVDQHEAAAELLAYRS